MSKLDKMIAKLCPDGVEYKTISELFNTRNGYTPSKAQGHCAHPSTCLS